VSEEFKKIEDVHDIDTFKTDTNTVRLDASGPEIGTEAGDNAADWAQRLKGQEVSTTPREKDFTKDRIVSEAQMKTPHGNVNIGLLEMTLGQAVYDQAYKSKDSTEVRGQKEAYSLLDSSIDNKNVDSIETAKDPLTRLNWTPDRLDDITLSPADIARAENLVKGLKEADDNHTNGLISKDEWANQVGYVMTDERGELIQKYIRMKEKGGQTMQSEAAHIESLKNLGASHARFRKEDNQSMSLEGWGRMLSGDDTLMPTGLESNTYALNPVAMLSLHERKVAAERDKSSIPGLDLKRMTKDLTPEQQQKVHEVQAEKGDHSAVALARDFSVDKAMEEDMSKRSGIENFGLMALGTVIQPVTYLGGGLVNAEAKLIGYAAGTVERAIVKKSVTAAVAKSAVANAVKNSTALQVGAGMIKGGAHAGLFMANFEGPSWARENMTLEEHLNGIASGAALGFALAPVGMAIKSGINAWKNKKQQTAAAMVGLNVKVETKPEVTLAIKLAEASDLYKKMDSHTDQSMKEWKAADDQLMDATEQAGPKEDLNGFIDRKLGKKPEAPVSDVPLRVNELKEALKIPDAPAEAPVSDVPLRVNELKEALKIPDAPAEAPVSDVPLRVNELKEALKIPDAPAEAPVSDVPLRVNELKEALKIPDAPAEAPVSDVPLRVNELKEALKIPDVVETETGKEVHVGDEKVLDVSDTDLNMAPVTEMDKKVEALTESKRAVEKAADEVHEQEMKVQKKSEEAVVPPEEENQVRLDRLAGEYKALRDERLGHYEEYTSEGNPAKIEILKGYDEKMAKVQAEISDINRKMYDSGHVKKEGHDIENYGDYLLERSHVLPEGDWEFTPKFDGTPNTSHYTLESALKRIEKLPPEWEARPSLITTATELGRVRIIKRKMPKTVWDMNSIPELIDHLKKQGKDSGLYNTLLDMMNKQGFEGKTLSFEKMGRTGSILGTATDTGISIMDAAKKADPAKLKAVVVHELLHVLTRPLTREKYKVELENVLNKVREAVEKSDMPDIRKARFNDVVADVDELLVHASSTPEIMKILNTVGMERTRWSTVKKAGEIETSEGTALTELRGILEEMITGEDRKWTGGVSKDDFSYLANVEEYGEEIEPWYDVPDAGEMKMSEDVVPEPDTLTVLKEMFSKKPEAEEEFVWNLGERAEATPYEGPRIDYLDYKVHPIASERSPLERCLAKLNWMNKQFREGLIETTTEHGEALKEFNSKVARIVESMPTEHEIQKLVGVFQGIEDRRMITPLTSLNLNSGKLQAEELNAWVDHYEGISKETFAGIELEEFENGVKWYFDVKRIRELSTDSELAQTSETKIDQVEAEYESIKREFGKVKALKAEADELKALRESIHSSKDLFNEQGDFKESILNHMSVRNAGLKAVEILEELENSNRASADIQESALKRIAEVFYSKVNTLERLERELEIAEEELGNANKYISGHGDAVEKKLKVESITSELEKLKSRQRVIPYGERHFDKSSEEITKEVYGDEQNPKVAEYKALKRNQGVVNRYPQKKLPELEKLSMIKRTMEESLGRPPEHAEVLKFLDDRIAEEEKRIGVKRSEVLNGIKKEVLESMGETEVPETWGVDDTRRVRADVLSRKGKPGRTSGVWEKAKTETGKELPNMSEEAAKKTAEKWEKKGHETKLVPQKSVTDLAGNEIARYSVEIRRKGVKGKPGSGKEISEKEKYFKEQYDKYVESKPEKVKSFVSWLETAKVQNPKLVEFRKRVQAHPKYKKSGSVREVSKKVSLNTDEKRRIQEIGQQPVYELDATEDLTNLSRDEGFDPNDPGSNRDWDQALHYMEGNKKQKSKVWDDGEERTRIEDTIDIDKILDGFDESTSRDIPDVMKLEKDYFQDEHSMLPSMNTSRRASIMLASDEGMVEALKRTNEHIEKRFSITERVPKGREDPLLEIMRKMSVKDRMKIKYQNPLDVIVDVKKKRLDAWADELFAEPVRVLRGAEHLNAERLQIDTPEIMKSIETRKQNMEAAKAAKEFTDKMHEKAMKINADIDARIEGFEKDMIDGKVTLEDVQDKIDKLNSRRINIKGDQKGISTKPVNILENAERPYEKELVTEYRLQADGTWKTVEVEVANHEVQNALRVLEARKDLGFKNALDEVMNQVDPGMGDLLKSAILEEQNQRFLDMENWKQARKDTQRELVKHTVLELQATALRKKLVQEQIHGTTSILPEC